MGVVLKDKFTARSIYIKKGEISYLQCKIHLKALEPKEVITPQRSRWQEIKLGAEINKVETNKTKRWFFEKIKIINKSLSKLTKRWKEIQINKIRKWGA